jgi:hypothetical protein
MEWTAEARFETGWHFNQLRGPPRSLSNGYRRLFRTAYVYSGREAKTITHVLPVPRSRTTGILHQRPFVVIVIIIIKL